MKRINISILPIDESYKRRRIALLQLIHYLNAFVPIIFAEGTETKSKGTGPSFEKLRNVLSSQTLTKSSSLFSV